MEALHNLNGLDITQTQQNSVVVMMKENSVLGVKSTHP